MVATLCAPLPAIAAPDHDIHFLSEHVPESGMDADYASLPWPGGQLAPDRWQTSVDVAAAHTRTEFIELDGPIVAVAAGTGVNDRWGYQVMGFYADMRVSGEGGRAPLTAGLQRDVPLDLPQLADFANARGTVRHFGIGAAAVHARGLESRSAQLIAGVLLEGLDVDAFQLDYRLVAGADAAGLVEHSSLATFVTPFVAWQQTRRISERWTWSPRARLMFPLPPGDFTGRVTGPGFDLETPRDGPPIGIGDPFVSLGLAFAHAPSGFEVDVGGMLFFAAGEHVSHAGVQDAVLLHFAWRPRAR